MKKEFDSKSYTLNAAAVDEISDFIQEYCADCGTEKKLSVRARLTAEEILLQWLDSYGAGAEVTVIPGKRLGKNYFQISIAGESFDPFRSETNQLGSFSTGMLKSLGLAPDYAYLGGNNIFTFKLKRKPVNPLLTLLISIGFALLIGYLGRFIPDAVRTALVDGVITPINDTFLNVLSCAAGPMIFLSVAWGIYGIGDTTTLSRIGKQMIGSFIGTLFLVVVVFGSIMLAFFDLGFSGGMRSTAGLESIFRLVLDIFPRNIFSPFIDGNSLQIIFLGFLIGIAMLFLGKRTEVVAQAVEQINYIVQFLVEFISKLVPYFIFIVVLRFLWAGTGDTLLGLYKFILIFACIICSMALALVIFTAIRQRANPLQLIQKGLPVLLIAITTASSAASFGTNVNTCEKKFGIDQSVSSFGIPLGMVMYKPATALCFLGFSFCFAEMYQVECSVGWVVMAFLVVTILAVATPPIPGGALTAYTIIFTMLDIPTEGLAVALALDVIMDFIDTGFNQFLLPFALINQAGKIGRLDTEILRKK